MILLISNLMGLKMPVVRQTYQLCLKNRSIGKHYLLTGNFLDDLYGSVGTSQAKEQGGAENKNLAASISVDTKY